MDEQEGRGVRYVRVAAEHAGRRIDNFLAGELGRVPRGYLYRILRRGEVRVNGCRVQAGHRLAAGDQVRIPPQRSGGRLGSAAPAASGWIEARVVYEDDSLLVLDKPPGIPAHAGTGHGAGVIELLRAARGGARYLELVHRLDRDTSGCLLVAKTRPRLLALQEALRNGALGKRYLTLVAGEWPAQLKWIDLAVPERRDGRGEAGTAAAGKQRQALTRFEVLSRLAGASYLEVALVTGRMHQIRAHAAGAGHPLAGDERYGDARFNRRLRALGLRRLFLHAKSLSMPAAGGGELLVSAPLPGDLREVLDALPAAARVQS